ncbi:MAG: UDP-N-acetylmuramoyl-L-alanine--D-glutamate ligase [Anaerolineales bacterium]
MILGFARQGKALARYFASRGAQVTVSDQRSADEFVEARRKLADLPLRYEFGGHPDSLLVEADLLCLSGGVPADLPLVSQAQKRGIPVSNDAQITLEACRAPIIGITGSAGKSTTSALIGEIGRVADRRTWVGGNIGRSLLDDLSEIRMDDLVVLELSSFQLELMTSSPHVAAVLNITPNHLDRHHTMARYIDAKARILAFQSSEDVSVLGHDDPQAWGLRNQVRGRLLSFGWGEPPEGEGAFLRRGELILRFGGVDTPLMSSEEVRLPGKHNLLNVAAACAVAAAVGLPAEAMAKAARLFAGLPHRLQAVRVVTGVSWVDDSIATTPERSLAGLRSIDEPIVLLAGGRDKGLPWSDWAEEAVGRCRAVIGFGECGQTVVDAVRAVSPEGGRPQVVVQTTLEAAVGSAAELAQAGDVVLLSPGGTSFDAFQDFEARGDKFQDLVKAL